MIRIQQLTKQYGATRAVDGLTFDVEPGKVTGFLGPNGAGKSTTMRIVMGLDHPTSGTATINGKPYADLHSPLREVGALLDPGAMHPGRTGRAHLRIAARSNGLPISRVDEVIEHVGLGPAARRRIKGYSLGMRQRLGIAAALLGDPQVLLFDEPVNGLDVEGVRWIRDVLRGFADEGRTVLVSSHLMSEMQLIADRVVVIGRGTLIADADVGDILRGPDQRRIRVRSPEADALAAALHEGGQVEHTRPGELVVTGMTATEVGDIAHALRFPLYHLAEIEQSLEHAYLALTADSVEYAVGGPSTSAEGETR
ncbi:ABC transporter ATP-binding protein [Mumia sp. Pv 4-285]|uniref:ABC transporter ATP-binding protein n=1 Tax=Mumia qirimensis TaxID=3234852 RepID=UPI00351CF62C